MLTIEQIYKTAITCGIESDPRGEKYVLSELTKTKEEYDSLKEDKKAEFDNERLINPYDDTRILYGDVNKRIKTILIGIDMEIGEVLLADRLRGKGRMIDLIISHHPEGYAMAGFYAVMEMQADVLNKFGVPINVAEGIMKERISEVERRVSPVNHNRAVDAANLLDIPLMCIHTPADNMVTSFLQQLIDDTKPETIKDIVKLLKDIPEYKMAVQDKAGPKIFVGAEKNRAGKIFVEMTGGTEGSKHILEKLSQAGVGTVIGMHYSEDLRKEAEKHHVNVVIAGHMASDSLGINLLLDKIDKEHQLEIIACSGFRRIER